jgi:hypothetical protein
MYTFGLQFAKSCALDYFLSSVCPVRSEYMYTFGLQFAKSCALDYFLSSVCLVRSEQMSKPFLQGNKVTSTTPCCLVI